MRSCRPHSPASARPLGATSGLHRRLVLLGLDDLWCCYEPSWSSFTQSSRALSPCLHPLPSAATDPGRLDIWLPQDPRAILRSAPRRGAPSQLPRRGLFCAQRDSRRSPVCLAHRPNLFISKSLLRTDGRSIHEDEITTDPSFDAILLILSSWRASKASNSLCSSCRLGFPVRAAGISTVHLQAARSVASDK